MRLVEFVGVPGAGKTSLHREAVACLAEAGVPAWSPADVLTSWLRDRPRDPLVRLAGRMVPRGFDPQVAPRLFARSQDRHEALVQFLTRRPALVESVLASQRLRGDVQSRPDLAIAWMVRLCTSFQLATEQLADREVLVVDEGFAQRVTTLFAQGFRHEDEAELSRYLAEIPVPAILVHVDAPVEVCAERLKGRGRAALRFEGAPAAARRAFLESARSCVERAVADLSARGAAVLRIPNRGGPAEGVAELRAQLRRRGGELGIVHDLLDRSE